MEDMGAPVPIFGESVPGSELASIPGEEVDEHYGLRWNSSKGQWEHPRLALLREKRITVADLDDEELQRGQLRDSDGKFRGGPLRKIPREFHDELMRRILDVGAEQIRGSYLSAIGLLARVVDGTEMDKDGNEPDLSLRGSTAKYLVERLAGKTPDRVEVAVAVKPWEKTMEAILVEVPEEYILAEEVDDGTPDMA